MQIKTFKINGFDATIKFTPYGYSVSYEKVTGSNSGFMLDGSYVEDVYRWRENVAVPTMPLSEDDLHELLNMLIPNTYIRLYYFSPLNKAYREEYFVYDGFTENFRGMGADGKFYWTGPALVFKEARRSEA